MLLLKDGNVRHAFRISFTSSDGGLSSVSKPGKESHHSLTGVNNPVSCALASRTET